MTPVARTRLICPLTAITPAAMRDAMIAAAGAGADTVECRLDCLLEPPSEEDLAAMLHAPPVDVIVTCRPRRESGRFAGEEADRLALLRRAARHAPTYVDVERDVPLSHWPHGRVILSHHDFKKRPEDLDAIVAALEASPAAVSKVAFAAAAPEDALRAFDVLRACRKPAMVLAMGQAGVTSRVLARKFGAFGTFAALARGAESAPGQPTIEEIRNLYRWDSIGPDTQVYGVIGCPVGHSMSPVVHNAAFAAAGIDAVYVPLLVQTGAAPFNRFLDALLERPWLNWRGLSVTIPHKANALSRVGAERCDALSARIGAINTITIAPDGGLRGNNTDYAAALDALCQALETPREGLAGRIVAVLGAGGAARAIVAALAHYGARTTIYNRTVSRGKRLAEEFDARSAGLDDLPQTDAEILINCTPIGMHPRVEASPLEGLPPSVRVVFDTIYNPAETRLLRQAASAGRRTVSGLDMFVHQAAVQFELWTARPAPREVMREVVLRRLAEQD